MTLFELAQRFIGIAEFAGKRHHPLIVWWLSLCGLPDQPDEVPWCSAFVNGCAWILRLPRSKSAAARSWLEVGVPIPQAEARVGDVVILTRGAGPQPGPEVTSGAPGHVGLFAGWEPTRVLLLGGNHANRVSVSSFPVSAILGIRRIEP